MRQYLDLVKHVLATGSRKENRTGVDTISTFGYYYEHDMREGFPLLTTKKLSWKNIVIELLWFLSGTNESAFLDRHSCGFWRPWYDKKGGVFAAYGPAWRRFEYPRWRESETGLVDDGYVVAWNDQVRWVLDKLKRSPMARDLVVSAWQPHIAQQPPTANAYWAPCHAMWILNVQNEELFEHPYSVFPNDDPHWEHRLGYVMASTQEEADAKAREKFRDEGRVFASDTQSQFELAVAKSKRWNPSGSPDGWLDKPMIPEGHRQRLCLHLTQRSCDVALGIPYNIASYGLLLSLMARFAGMEPGVFGHTLVDAHIYCAKPDGSKAEFDHIPGLQEQLQRKLRPLPRLIIDDSIRDLSDVEALLKPEVTTDEIMAKFRIEGYQPHENIPFKVAV